MSYCMGHPPLDEEYVQARIKFKQLKARPRCSRCNQLTNCRTSKPFPELTCKSCREIARSILVDKRFLTKEMKEYITLEYIDKELCGPKHITDTITARIGLTVYRTKYYIRKGYMKC